MINKTEKLEPEKYYHIFNRAVGNEILFKSDRDYSMFFSKLRNFILPVCDLIAYCLIPNHFHFFIRTFDEVSIQNNLKLINQDQIFNRLNLAFSNFFNAYAKAFNLKYSRKGELFMFPFKRIVVEDQAYFISIINYIHRNPVHHGLVKHHEEWKYSSFNTYLSKNETSINRELGMAFFGDLDEFIRFHKENNVKKGTREFLVE